MGKKNPIKHTFPDVCKAIKPAKVLFHQTFEEKYGVSIPDPSILEKYNTIIPDGAERIMRMAEKQQEHILFIEKELVNGTIGKTKRGQTFGFIIAVIVLICATYLTFIGNGNIGKMLLGIPFVTLVAVFVVGKFKKIK